MRHTRTKVVVLLAFAFVLIFALSNSALAAGAAVPASDLKHATFVHYATADPAANIKALGTSSPNDYYQDLGLTWATLPLAFSADTDYAPANSFSEIGNAFATWDNATAKVLFKPLVLNRSVEPSLRRPDYKNTVTFRRLAGSPNVLAVTYLWYTKNNVILDADIVVNTKFTWAVDPDDEGPLWARTTKTYYEVHDVVTHEVGHVLGLADLYAPEYGQLTMYGYSAAKETLKITLESGDILGTQHLYGP